MVAFCNETKKLFIVKVSKRLILLIAYKTGIELMVCKGFFFVNLGYIFSKNEYKVLQLFSKILSVFIIGHSVKVMSSKRAELMFCFCF